MLRPRERRRPQMPNQLPKMVEERIVSFSIAHPGLGPRRVADENLLGRREACRGPACEDASRQTSDAY
jgi:hypothetical protein